MGSREETATHVRSLRELAAGNIRQGEQYEQKGQANQAEKYFLTALKIQKQIVNISRDEKDICAAIETCISLADLCMQQGNMHGADYYYAKAMEYGQKDRSPC